MKNTQSIKVLVSRVFPPVAVRMLEKAGFTVTSWEVEMPMSQTDLIELCKVHNSLLCTVTEQIDDDFLRECSHLDIISQYGVGFDNIDIEAATKLGIPVTNTPDVMSEATADIAFGLMIAASRKMFYLYKTILKGGWKHFNPNAHLGIELKGKTLGVFGLGRIGFEMAKRCKGAYNMDVIYYNRKPNHKAEMQLQARYVEFNNLLRESDIISVHCPLTDSTRNKFNKGAFKQMKPTAIFVNTSRGQVHNEQDLIWALENKKIWGAGLDVCDPEPMNSKNLLLEMENVAVLPHVGSATIEARDKMARIAAQNIIDYYTFNKLPNLVNRNIMFKV